MLSTWVMLLFAAAAAPAPPAPAPAAPAPPAPAPAAPAPPAPAPAAPAPPAPAAPAAPAPTAPAAAAPAAAAPKADLVLRPSLDKTKGHIGDLFTYTLRITHPPDERYLVPPEPSFAPFTLRGREPFRRDLEDGKVEETFVFRLTIYKTGTHRIPPIDIPFVTRDGTTRRAVAQDVDITVESLLPPGAEIPPLKPVKPPMTVRVRDWRPLYAAAILAGLLVLAGIAWLAYRYGKKLAARPRPAPPPPPPRPAHLIAYEKLAHVALPTTDAELRAFYEQVSMIAREYLGNRYGFLALDMTTTEILKELRARRPAGLEIPMVSELLAESDLVKFAKFVPGANAPQEHLAAARRLVDATREAEPAPSAAQEQKAA